MHEQFIKELEDAAQILMAPPNIVSNDQRHEAERVFRYFRQAKSPYVICREILEKTLNQYVMFEAAEVLKGAVIREWSFLLDGDRTSLRQYLMQYVTTRAMPYFLREKILQVIAIMVKRSSIDDAGRERGLLLQEVENLIVNAELDKKLLGCNIITNLLMEYATTVKSTDVGLPWEIHFKAKKQFETTDLKRIFQFCVYLLSEAVKNDPPYSDVMVQLTRHLLQITERILTWGFISYMPRRIIGIYETLHETENGPALKLSKAWSDIIFNPDFLPLMFQIYWKFRESEDLAHHALNCLVQLSSLSGPILMGDEENAKYVHDYIMSFLKLVSNTTIRSKEALGISNIARKLVIFFVRDLTKLPVPVQETLVDEFTRLTCNFCEGSVQEDTEGDGERYYTDSFEAMLEAWMVLIQELSTIPDETHRACATTIFNKYLQCHLAPPDGIRAADIGREGVVALNEDNEDNDRIKYKEQLQSIGMFGRLILRHSLPVLCKLLESRLEALFCNLQIMQHRAMNINESATLDNLFEDIHWIVLISGHVLAMEAQGEEPLMPKEIVAHSIELGKSGAINADASINALVATDAKPGLPDNIDRCDPSLRIAANVMRLCSIEDAAVAAKLSHFMSPEVGSSLMWFLKRWCLTYLLPDEEHYFELSPVLLACLGKDTDCGKAIIHFVLNKVAVNLYSFQSEPVLLRDTVEVFTDMVSKKDKAIHIIRTESMAKLVSLAEQMPPGTLPPNILRGLYKGFALAGVCLTDPVEINTYCEKILNPLQQRCKNIAGQENLQRVCQEEQVQKVFIDIMECFIGIAKGSMMRSVEILFNFMAPILSELSVFLTLYKDYQVIVQLILELFGHCAKYMLAYLKPLDTKRFYESVLSTVYAYAKCNTNRLSTETFAEESSCQDLSLMVDLLTFILSKDCIDLCITENQVEINMTASDISLFGLNFLLPLMSLELLKFPGLCTKYYTLLVLINDIYPEKIVGLSPEMHQSLLKSIELSLTNFGNDTVRAGLDFVQGMASYVFRNKTQEAPFSLALKPFLKLILDLTLSRQLNSEVISNASTTIYCLICCYQEEYQMLVNRIIEEQSDPLVKERLAAAFNNLTEGVEFNCNRNHKIKFRDNFDKFIPTVHAFLLIK